MENQIENNVHSPGLFRIIGPTSNFDEFYRAFNCPANKPVKPENRCTVW